MDMNVFSHTFTTADVTLVLVVIQNLKVYFI